MQLLGPLVLSTSTYTFLGLTYSSEFRSRRNTVPSPPPKQSKKNERINSQLKLRSVNPTRMSIIVRTRGGGGGYCDDSHNIFFLKWGQFYNL